MHFSIYDKETFADKGMQGAKISIRAIRMFCAIAFVLALFFSTSTIANGQDLPIVPPPSSHDVDVQIDSRLTENVGGGSWSETVRINGAQWLQLHFSDVVLTENENQTSILKITSLEDEAFQILDAKSCEQWRNKSAFFNGDAVKVELLSDAQSDRVVIDKVTVGDIPEPAESICDAVDDRVLSNDPRVGRTNSRCTAWLFNGRQNGMITAGHCVPGLSTVFFNVPLSDPNGSLNFPPPEDQYAVCPDSVQNQNGTIEIGNDWAFFGVFDNSNTGLSPLAAQGDSYTIAVPKSSTFNSNDPIRVTGFGMTTFPVDPSWNQAQKTDVGPFASFIGTTLRYRADTTGGNSGSPVILDSSGIAYGVHTNGTNEGCFNGGGSNSGTGFNNRDFWTAINNPQGCLPPFVLGDVNLNGVTNFQDIPPFITLLINGEYREEADINRDGVVNFQDIPPFIEILQAQ